MELSKRREPKPDIEILFQGPDVYPELVPIRAVADAIAAVSRLGTPSRQLQEQDEGGSAIRLLKLRRGSARYLCVADNPGQFRDRIRERGTGIASEVPSETLGDALRPIQRLSEIAHSLKCRIIIRDPDDPSDVLARIEPDTFSALSSQLVLEGIKSFSGNVQRAGGAIARRVALRVPFQPTLLYCSVADDELVRRLGGLLYQDVLVTGRVRWVRATWTILEFVVQEVTAADQSSIPRLLSELRKAGADAWDDIGDPLQYLRETAGGP